MVGIENIIYDEFSNNYYDYAESISVGKDTIFKYGLVSSSQTSRIEIENEVFYAELDYDKIEKHIDTKPKIFKKVSKFPVVSRDISILVDENIKFRNIQESIKKVNQGLSEKENYHFLSDKYGDWILFNTPLKKNSYFLWFMPYILFILGGAILYIMIKKRTEKIK